MSLFLIKKSIYFVVIVNIKYIMETTIKTKEICPTATQTWVTKNALLIDVRERDLVEQLSFDVPSIKYIPLSELEVRFEEIPMNQKVVFVCQDGVSSAEAAIFMTMKGYTNIMHMRRGIIRWAEKGYPVVGDTSEIVAHNCHSGEKCH
jgi:rhodanese-related sulfurtransferase